MNESESVKSFNSFNSPGKTGLTKEIYLSLVKLLACRKERIGGALRFLLDLKN